MRRASRMVDLETISRLRTRSLEAMERSGRMTRFGMRCSSMAGMIATSAAPARRASAHSDGTVNERSYLPCSGPCVKPRTSGAVLRYCTTEVLYQSSVPAGVGSNDIGLDRGQLGETRIVRFERSGPKVLLVQENLSFRAVSDDKDEKRAVHDSFAESVIWGFTAAAEENGHVLVDATEFYLRDAHGVVTALKRTKQGAYKLDGSRSAIYMANTKNFPLNTEVEATLTFTGDEPGKWAKDVTPDATAITVREHHSFVQLPPGGYKTREYDPRSSFYGVSYMDYAAPVSDPIVNRFTARHRLEKKDPPAATTKPVDPMS